MTKNSVGVAVAVVALGAIFFFGHPAQKSAPPSPPPAPEKSVPAIVKPPITKPVPAKPGKPNPNPVIYHRVGQDGKQGPEVACTSVTSFAEGKSEAELAVLAKQYGVTVAEVRKWFICVK